MLMDTTHHLERSDLAPLVAQLGPHDVATLVGPTQREEHVVVEQGFDEARLWCVPATHHPHRLFNDGGVVAMELGAGI